MVLPVTPVTVAVVAPKKTTLLLAVVSKLFPLSIIVDPTNAFDGLNELMTGAGGIVTFCSTDNVLDPTAAKSSLPSTFKSPIATEYGLVVVA